MLDADYWDAQYHLGQTGWDLGAASTPIHQYFDQLPHRHWRILVPGAGNGYEVEHLYALGFEQVYLLDFSAKAIDNFHQRNPQFPEEQLLHSDFFAHHGQYDLIIEHTFLSALHPAQRQHYAQHIHQLLAPGGRLVGVVFSSPFPFPGPPYGAHPHEYEQLFAPYFQLHKLEPCYNSVKPRAGNELFIHLIRKELEEEK